MSGRSHSVLINGTQSKPILICGVPIGSVVGLIKISICMLHLVDIMNKHMHADDCELYTILEASNINQVALDIKS